MLDAVPLFGVSLLNPSPLLRVLLCCFDTVGSPVGGLLLPSQCKGISLPGALLRCRFALLRALLGCLGALSFFCFAARILL
jgi:hypothetical protein